jgi:dihydrofolate reductase
MRAIMSITRKIIGIMAATKDGVVGDRGGLPWTYPEELEHFYRTTKGNVVIMGSKTYDTAPARLFDDRKAIVLSKQIREDEESVCFVQSLTECLELIQELDPSQKVFMIGGAEIAHLFLCHNLLSSFILTQIHGKFSGDTRLNMLYFDDWKERVLTEKPDYTIMQLVNRSE